MLTLLLTLTLGVAAEEPAVSDRLSADDIQTEDVAEPTLPPIEIPEYLGGGYYVHLDTCDTKTQTGHVAPDGTETCVENSALCPDDKLVPRIISGEIRCRIDPATLAVADEPAQPRIILPD